MPAAALPRLATPVEKLAGTISDVVLFLSLILLSTQQMTFQPVLVMVLLGLFAVLAASNLKAFGLTLLRWWPLLLTPLVALASAMWSDVPALSARYAAQLCFTCLLGVHLARLMTPQRFLNALFVSTFVFCIMCLVYGRQGYSTEGAVLIGLTGSKNQMGFISQLLVIAAIAVLLQKDTPRQLRLAALLSLPLGLFLLIQAKATGAILLAIVGVMIFVGFWMLQRLNPGGRAALIIGTLMVLAPLAALTPELNEGLNYVLTDTLGKDTTLTGRTYLWERADELSAQRPLLGYGYQAIWIGDSADTIGLLRWAGLQDGRMFSFHNTFVQLRVDIGWIGLGIFLVTLAAVLFAWVRQVLMRPSMALMFFFTLFALYLARSFAEVIITPISSYTALFFACCVFAFRQPAQLQQR